MKFNHHKYTWINAFGSVRHLWEFVGPDGAVSFSASVSPKWETSCGLEFHQLGGAGAPNHINCPLTGGWCWHDGTSLYATESVWPQIRLYVESNNHEAVFKILEHEYVRHFEDSVEEE